MNEKLTYKQAEVLEELRVENSNSKIVHNYTVEYYDIDSPIYELSLDTLIKALYVGYEVVEEKVKYVIENMGNIVIESEERYLCGKVVNFKGKLYKMDLAYTSNDIAHVFLYELEIFEIEAEEK